MLIIRRNAALTSVTEHIPKGNGLWELQNFTLHLFLPWVTLTQGFAFMAWRIGAACPGCSQTG